jgi:hypothetical protein
MSDFYSEIEAPNKGAWVVHHGRKVAATTNGSAEFPALDAASKAASLLSQFAAAEETTLEASSVSAFAKAAGLSRLELPALLAMLKQRRLIEVGPAQDVAVLGVTSRATVQHAAEIFEDQAPSNEERAAIALAEVTSSAPQPSAEINEFISDEFFLPKRNAADLLARAEQIGFIDAEGQGNEKLFFNGNIFRRDNLAKTKRVLDSLSTCDQGKAAEVDARLAKAGCLSIEDVEKVLGRDLFDKLRAAGMYDINHVANSSGEFVFVTRPAAFHKFNDPLVDDAFDLAKAFVAALFYGMTQSRSDRGKIQMIAALVKKLIAGGEVGPATAIGEDYRVLETKGVISVKAAKPYGYVMRLRKKDIGEMALKVLTTGEVAQDSALDRPLPGSMTGYKGPEETRTHFRRREQLPESKRMTHDILEVLRTKGTLR